MRKLFSFAVLCSALTLASCDSQLDEPAAPVDDSQSCKLSVICQTPDYFKSRSMTTDEYQMFNFDNTPMGWEAVCAIYNTDGTLYKEKKTSGYGTLVGGVDGNYTSLVDISLPLNKTFKIIIFAGKRGYDGKCPFVYNSTDKTIKYSEEIIKSLQDNSTRINGGGNISWTTPIASGTHIFNYKLTGKTGYCTWNTAFENYAKCGDCFYYFGDLTTGSKPGLVTFKALLKRPMVNVRLISATEKECSTENVNNPWQLRKWGANLDGDTYVPVGYNVWTDNVIELNADNWDTALSGIFSLGGYSKLGDSYTAIQAANWDKPYYYFANWYMFESKTPSSNYGEGSAILQILRKREVVQQVQMTDKMGQGGQVTFRAASFSDKSVSASVAVNGSFEDNTFTTK